MRAAPARSQASTGSLTRGRWVAGRGPQLWLGLALAEADRPDEASAALQAGSRHDSDHGGGAWRSTPLHHWALAYAAWVGGRWDDVVFEVQAGLTAAERTGTGHDGGPLAFVGVVVEVDRDHIAEARRLCTRLRRHVEPTDPWARLWCRGAEALVLEAQGDRHAALEVMTDGWNASAPVRHLPGTRFFGPELVRLALLGDDRWVATRVTEEVEEAAACVATPGLVGAALRCRGVLDDDATVLLEAVAALGLGVRPMEIALAREEAAMALRRAGQHGHAAALLHQALVTYETLMAARALARVAPARELVRDHRGRVARSGLHPPAISARRWECNLSARELEVLELMADGMSTRAIAERLYVSSNTVRNHAQNVLRKLGVHSRLAAVSLARREGILGSH